MSGRRSRRQRGGDCVLDTDGTMPTKFYFANKSLIESIMRAIAKVFKSTAKAIKEKLKGKKRCDPDLTEFSRETGKAMGWSMYSAVQGALRWPGIEAGYGRKGAPKCGD